MNMIRRLILLLVLLFPAVEISAQEAPDLSRYEWEEVASDFDSPVYVTHAGDDRLFVLEQGGLIWIVENGEVSFDPFLDISLLLPDGVFRGGYSEQGLLGLAFHPDYGKTGLFFITYTDVNGDVILARYSVMADNTEMADPDSGVVILKVEHPYDDHNGGQISFGSDGYLYVGMGDGGSVDDPHSNGQNTSTLLGKLLRIDVNADTYTVPDSNPFVGNADYVPEIWALGLRNPWRFSFDRLTGDLYIGDVGQWEWEEIDFQPAASPGGENYGWSAYQGNHEYLDVPVSGEVMMPAAEFPHSEGCAVIGGYVYRGATLPELQGAYFFGDYCSGNMWTMFRDDAGEWQTAPFMDTEQVISSFGEDAQGELYSVDFKGGIYKLVAAPSS
jgi:glucose/arabinose dehydrogenase